MRPNRLRKWVLRSIIAVLVPFLSFLSWNHFSGNFGTVSPFGVYRAAQMDSHLLARTIRNRSIKTVLNLRGHHPETSWYQAERDVTLSNGAVQIDVALSSCEWMSRAQAAELVNLLDHATRPMLIHCYHGSERTGLVAAFSELLRPGASLADARAQFTVAHLYFGLGDGVVMAQHLDQYEGWLHSKGMTHSPDHFRDWIKKGYVPGSPSREEWPYDPYPLKVVSRRSSDPAHPTEEVVEWAPGSEPGSPKRTASLRAKPLH